MRRVIFAANPTSTRFTFGAPIIQLHIRLARVIQLRVLGTVVGIYVVTPPSYLHHTQHIQRQYVRVPGSPLARRLGLQRVLLAGMKVEITVETGSGLVDNQLAFRWARSELACVSGSTRMGMAKRLVQVASSELENAAMKVVRCFDQGRA
ncbi:hypothetical protein BDN72DRAFT_648263 [Pluteus cervinus]|uniref:Uncharacterized protein n=1 Tax=Pluteus cervinus TaxID=181527 RepID=A0ACD2ZZQ9_9AGAR|nr:hypothetical protein BDN72DRAFT_648263 [Pluteus cervinus]